MSNVLITKFPVTAPDGSEYRVKIRECEADGFWSAFACVKLYVKRPVFGFRRVCGATYHEGRGLYNPRDPDYAAITTQMVMDYYAGIKAREESKRQETAEKMRKQVAVERFNAWDGKITEGGA